MAKSCLISIISFLLISFHCFSQRQEIRFNHINSADGLSHSFVRKIIQDSQGFMWFATLEGVNKYDGYSIKTYQNDPKNKRSIASNDVWELFEDSKKRVWIGTRFGLSCYIREDDQFETDSVIGRNFIGNVFEDSNKEVWTHTGEKLYKYNEGQKTFVEYKVDGINGWITFINEDSYQNFWIGTDDAIYILDPNTRKAISQNQIPIKGINRYFEDSQGNIWFSSRTEGIIYYNIKSGKTVVLRDLKSAKLPSALLTSYTFAITEDSEGNIWFGMENEGLIIYNPKNHSFYTSKHEPGNKESLSFNTIYSFYRDKNKNMWLATHGGIDIVKRNKFNHYYHRYNKRGTLSSNNILSFEEDKDGRIWIGTDGGGLNLFDQKTNTFTSFTYNNQSPDGIGSNTIMSIKEDQKGNLWLGTWGGGLELFDTRNNTFKKFLASNNPESIRSNNVVNLYEDRNSNFWVGTTDGLDILDRESGKFIHYSNPENNVYGWISEIFEDKEGNLWIGTYTGLHVLDAKTKNATHYYNDENSPGSVSSNTIFSIYEDKKGNIWLGTGRGLNLFNKQEHTFTPYTVSNGLPSNAILNIVEDEDGKLWMATGNGLTSFDPAEKTFKNYNEGDGLQGNEFKEAAYLKTKSGEIFYGGANGFNVFNPRELITDTVPASVVITDFKIFNQTVPILKEGSPLRKQISCTEELILSYKDAVFSFDFSALDFTSPEKNQYAYMMEGFEENWNYSGNKRSATYTNLDPGTYTFKVKATNHDGYWNKKAKALKIIITPPFWKTIWFRVLLIILLILGIHLFIRLRIQRIKKQKEILKKIVSKKTNEIRAKNQVLEKNYDNLNKQKEEIISQKNEILEMSLKVKEADDKKIKFFANISHEFRTPLTLILGPVKDLVKREDDHKKRYQLGIVYNNAHKLLQMVNGLMDFQKLDHKLLSIQHSKGDIIKFCGELVSGFSVMASQKNITLNYFPKSDCLLTWFDAQKIQVIVYNLISNAIKYTPEGGSINVCIEKLENDNNILLRVEDSGIGIEPDQLNHIFDRYYQIETGLTNNGTGIGLAYTKEVVELMEGMIKVISNPGQGTTFFIYLPIVEKEMIGKENVDFSAKDPEDYYPELPLEVSPSTEHESGDNFKRRCPTVLIIDDNEELRKFIKGCIIDRYKVLEAPDGKEGVALAKEKLPNIIISDVMMPEIDGLELCKIIKSDMATSHIPLILLTARNDVNSQIEGYKLGADEYLAKPFSKEVLIARIENLLKIREKLRESFKTKLTVDPAHVSISSTDDLFITKAVELIENNITDSSFGTSSLVKELGMSRTVIYNKFKELTGFSTGEFIKTTRLKRATQLLKENKLRVSEICYMVGFTDPHYFSKSFKSVYGVSPTEFAENNKSQEIGD